LWVATAIGNPVANFDQLGMQPEPAISLEPDEQGFYQDLNPGETIVIRSTPPPSLPDSLDRSVGLGTSYAKTR
jgi:hypothetical protein